MIADPFGGDLFGDAPRSVSLGDGALLLRGFALAEAAGLVAAIPAIAATAPFRRMATPGGRKMAAAMTNCGHWGWTSGPDGYAYRDMDPETGRPWPPLPAAFAAMARRAALAAGHAGFDPDGCLINRYEVGAGMGLHQDRDEADPGQPIVSVSLGLSATFRWGGERRSDATAGHRLEHGDVVVWGGPSRLAFHGVGPPARGVHPVAGPFRYNLTFRRAKAVPA